MLPKAYIVGYTTIDYAGLKQYLVDTDNTEFLRDIADAKDAGLSDGEILCSLGAKICYASLTPGRNKNITGTRSIRDNLIGCFTTGHGSVFEHAYINFVATDVSRVFTHELVRHRAGLSFSQTSGRYVRTDELKVVSDPILALRGILSDEEAMELGTYLEDAMRMMSERIDALNADKDTKKKLTSAARRWLPNGIANEIKFGVNFRALRHVITVRTSRHAEWEIRKIFSDVYELCMFKFPLLFYGARAEMVNGAYEVTGMKHQPYDA